MMTPEFLTTRGIGASLEKIISESTTFLYLVSAYVHIPETLVGEINAAIGRGVKVKILSGKELESSTKRLGRLAELKGAYEIYHLERLHAKAYLSEKSSIVTSLNLVEFSEKNNEEFGVLADHSTEIYKGLKTKVERLFAESNKLVLSNGSLKFVNEVSSVGFESLQTGFCIRCSIAIPYNIKKPYCGKCYASWANYGDSTYLEKVCHQCGKTKADIDMDYPVCGTCWKSSRK
jgi:phosphatidylserine/phosphatidylglycerophosphate/cardiolipin synthase-like enzyme